MIFRRSPALAESLRRAAVPSSDPITAVQSVLWIALAIRKLSEGGELSLAMMRHAWPARLHWPRGDVLAPGDDLLGAYERADSRPQPLPTLRLCGLLIHSCLLITDRHGIYFTSQLEKDRGLFFVEWSTLGQMVESACDDRPRFGVIHAA